MTDLNAEQLSFLVKYLGLRSARPSGTSNIVELQKTRLTWDKTRKAVQSDLKALEAAINDVFNEDPSARMVAVSAKQLRKVAVMIDGRLLDKLDDALNAEDPAKRAKLQEQARSIVDDYLARVKTDPLIGMLDDNPFISVNIQKRLQQVLPELGKALT